MMLYIFDSTNRLLSIQRSEVPRVFWTGGYDESRQNRATNRAKRPPPLAPQDVARNVERNGDMEL